MANPFTHPFAPIAKTAPFGSGDLRWPLSIQAQGAAIKAAISRYHVPVQVFLGMYEQETVLGTGVRNSNKGAVGPFQFLPTTASSYGYPLTNSPTLSEFQAQANGAAHYLSDLYNQLGHDWTKALAGYNAGPGNIGAGLGYAHRALNFHIPDVWTAAVGPGAAFPGGTAGLGGTGALINDTANFTVGSTSNPDEDFWTAINRLAQERYWYVFSDGETLYLADGNELMKQTAAAKIDRIGNLPRINHLDLVFDNTAWTYSSTHKRRRRTQRRSILAKVTSPVECNLNLVSEIDEVRAGDVITLSGTGPADGNWLVASCRRSVFQVLSEIRLVPALHPLSENQVGGVGSNSNPLGGSIASTPGAGTVIAAMISRASTINNAVYPYVWGGGHAQVGVPSGNPPGFDCSGCVTAVLAAGHIWKQSSVGRDDTVISTLLASGLIQPGQGSGNPECTLFDNPGVHIFMRLNGVYFGTSDGFAGPSNKALPNSITGPAGGKGGGGGTWLTRGSDVGTFRSYHVLPNLLSQATPFH